MLPVIDNCTSSCDQNDGAFHHPAQPSDPDYRRLRYVRYADDFLLGFVGPASEAKDIFAIG